MEKINTFLKEFWWIGIIGLAGLGIVGYGFWEIIKPTEVKVEIISGEQRTANSVEQSQIVVDVAGAVEKPGVYKLPTGSRIGDALVLAGGLGVKADREWVSKTLNLAEVVKDGGKIYIPEIQTIGILGKSVSQTVRISESQSGKVNINTASEGELDSLAGIGAVRAKAIVDNRPYGATDEIISKAKVPQSIYEDIKDSLSIY